jgi:hypothetical protein
MTPEQFQRAQDARFIPWQPELLTCIIVRGEPITLAKPMQPVRNTPRAATVGIARGAIMTASWTSACAVKSERDSHGRR